MTNPSTRIVALEDDELEEFVELYAERKSKDYVEVRRVGAANDKGRDIIGFLSPARHEGETPVDISDEELPYISQLHNVYDGAAGAAFATLDDVFADPRFGEHLRTQRDRYYQACTFRDFHRDNTAAKSVDVFKRDIYHLLIDVYNETHPSPLARIDAVMKHTGAAPAGILGTMARPPVKQGTCHHLVSDGRIRWSP